VTASGRYANDHEYHGPFNDYIRDKKNQRAVYEYLLDMDIGEFNPMKDRPITTTHRELAENTLPVMDIFMEKNFHRMVEIADSSRSYTENNIRTVHPGLIEVKGKVLWEWFKETIDELHILNCESMSKVEKLGSTRLMEFRSKIERFVEEGNPGVVKKRYKYGTAWQFEVKPIQQYLGEKKRIAEEEEEVEMVGHSIKRKKSSFTVHHFLRGHTKYVVKNDGDPVYCTDDLEEVNKYIGEAYVEVRKGDDGNLYQVLVKGEKETDLGQEYMGEEGMTKLEMKYPWYKKDRCIN
jgi:hypothetical protein